MKVVETNTYGLENHWTDKHFDLTLTDVKQIELVLKEMILARYMADNYQEMGATQDEVEEILFS